MRQRSYSGQGVASASSSFVTRFDSPIRSVDPNRSPSATPERRGTDRRARNDGNVDGSFYNDNNYDDDDDDDDASAASPTVDEIERMLERLNLPQLRGDPTGSRTYRGGGAGGGAGNTQRDLSPKQKAAAAFNVTATTGAESAAASLRITGTSNNLRKDNVDRHGHSLLDSIPHVRSRAASVATTSVIPLAHEDEGCNAGRHNDDDDDDDNDTNNTVTPHQRIQRRPRTPPAADADNDGAEEPQGLQRSVSFAPTKVGEGAPQRTGGEGLQRAKSSAILRRAKSASGGGLARKSDSRLDATLSTEPSLPPPTVDAEAELRRSERVMIAMDFGVKADVGAAVRPGTAEMSQGMGAALGVASAAVSFEAARAMSRLRKATEPPEPVVALNIDMGADPRDGTVSHRRLLVYPNENPRDVAFRFILENSLDHDRALEPLTAYLQRAIDKKRARVAQAELEERLAAVANAGGGGDPFEHSGTDSDGSDRGGAMDPTSFRHRRRSSATPAPAFGRGVTFLRGTGGFTEVPPRGGEAKPPPAGHRPSRMEEQQMQSLRRRSHSFAGQSFVSTHTTAGARHASPGLSRLTSMHKKGFGGAPSGGSLQTKQTTSSDSADKSAVATEESNAGGDAAQTAATSAGAVTTAAKRREQLAARMKKQKEEDRALRGLTTEEREVRRMCTFKPSRQRTLSPPPPPPRQQHTTPATRSKTPPKAASRRPSLDDAGAVRTLQQQQRSRTPPVGTEPKAIQQRQQQQQEAAAAAALTPAQRVKAMFHLSTADAAAVSRALPGVVPTLSAEEKAALRKKAGGRYRRHSSSSPRRAPAIPLAGSDMAAIATAAARTAAIDRLSQPRAVTPKKVFAKPVTSTTAKATTRARTPR